MTTTGTAIPLDQGPERPEWHDRGLCGPWFAETGFDAWFGPDEDEMARATAPCTTVDQVREVKRELREEYRTVARKICRSCPVQLECLQFAMDNEKPDHRAGIWGGLKEAQRSHLATQRAAKAA